MLWSDTHDQKLNEAQSDSLYTAMGNKFQFIQGPPGEQS